MDLFQHAGEVCATTTLLLCLPCAEAVPADARASEKAVDSCRSHIHELVRFLRAAAETDGTALRVTWVGAERVSLHYDDFSQHMQCLDEELHVDMQDPAGMDWERSRED